MRRVTWAICIWGVVGVAPATTANPVITEVLYDPSGAEPQLEWVEFYNPGDAAVDLTDHIFGDEETSTSTGEMMLAFPSGASIGPRQVMIVANDGAAVRAAWSIPESVPIYARNNAAVGFHLDTSPTGWGRTNWAGLGNGGDELVLFKRNGPSSWVLVDGVSWGSGTTQTNGVQFIDQPAPDVATDADHSLERTNPSGDSDTAADWREQPTPTPGVVGCGDGVVGITEACDDGNLMSGDGCSPMCTPECGFLCDGELGCQSICQDGDVAGNEACDDGNAVAGDGCSPLCNVEPGYICTVPAPRCDGSVATGSACRLDPCSLPLRLTEIHVDGGSAGDRESEWFEVYNPGTLAIDLSFWSADDGEDRFTFPPGALLEPGAVAVAARDATTFNAEFGVLPDHVYGAAGNLEFANVGDSLELACADQARDSVSWGPGALLPVPTPGYVAGMSAGPQTFERIDPDIDTDGAADWTPQFCPTPGLPLGANQAPDAGAAVAQAEAGALTSLQLPGDDPDDDALTWAVSTTATMGTVVLDPATGLLSYDPEGLQTGADTLAFTVSDGCVTSVPYPLVIEIGPSVCDPNASALKINEVHVDARRDNRGEWVEIHNPLAVAVGLRNIRLGDAQSIGSVEGMHAFGDDVVLDGGATLVVAFSAAEFESDWGRLADHEWNRDTNATPTDDLRRVANWAGGTMRLGNDSDEVLIVDCHGAVVDAVYWGPSDGNGPAVEPPWSIRLPSPPGSYTGASSQSPTSFERRPGLADTHTAADFVLQRCPSPGRLNSDNLAPTVRDGIFALAQGAVVEDAADAEDVDGDPLSYRFVTPLPVGFSVTTPGDGAFVYAPPAGFVGLETVTFFVDDGCVESGASTLTFCVGSLTEIVGDAVDDDCDQMLACYEDLDGDSFGSTQQVLRPVGMDCIGGGAAVNAFDCDDVPSVCGSACSPILTESLAADNCADGWNNDCDAMDADDDAECIASVTCYRDRDGDGFGDPLTATRFEGFDAIAGCALVSDGPWVTWGTDCDDDPSACGAACQPGTAEVCDGYDNDCEIGTADGVDDDAIGVACDADGDTNRCQDDVTVCVDGALRCEDQSAGDVARVEVCDANQVDEDCDGGADDDDPDGPPSNAVTFFADADADGYGAIGSETVACRAPAGSAVEDGDCDDDQDGVHPGRTEVAGNEVDEDCDGVRLCWVDRDNDNVAADDAATGAAAPGVSCEDAFGLATRQGDCDDNPTGCGSNCAPGLAEICDGLDNDCNAAADDLPDCFQTTTPGNGDGSSGGAASGCQAGRAGGHSDLWVLLATLCIGLASRRRRRLGWDQR